MAVTESDPSTVKSSAGPMSKEWYWHPDLPISTSPIFAWPPRPLAAIQWLVSYWLALSSVVIELALAVAVWYWLQPEAAQMKSLSAGWIAQLYLRNLILLILVAGGLHLYFHVLRRQEQNLRFDTRGFARKNRRFTLGNQVWDNIFWSIASGVTVWTAFEVLYFWAWANGLVPGLEFRENPVWFVAWFVLIPIWSSMHFYWIHRLIHFPLLYRLIHSLHHRNVVIGPWTGISMHPVEHLLYFSSVLIHFVVASHPVHVLFHLYLEGLNPAFSHSGYEGIEVKGNKLMKTGDFFHQLHHRYFECNYGTAEMPWDRWFGSFHDGTRAAHDRMRELQRKRQA